MSIDRIAPHVVHCKQGLNVLGRVRQSQTTLRRLAHTSARNLTPERVEEIATTKAKVVEAERLYLEHVETCTDCHERERSTPRAPKAASAKPVGDRPPCPRCGRTDVDHTRKHRDPHGDACMEAVDLTELPPVVFPGGQHVQPRQPGTTQRKEARPRYATGRCHDCGAPVTGERWYCAKDAMERQLRRTR